MGSSKSIIETVEKVIKIFKADNKGTRTMSITSFWYVVTVKLEHISHLFLVFPVNFEQLNVC